MECLQRGNLVFQGHSLKEKLVKECNGEDRPVRERGGLPQRAMGKRKSLGRKASKKRFRGFPLTTGCHKKVGGGKVRCPPEKHHVH